MKRNSALFAGYFLLIFFKLLVRFGLQFSTTFFLANLGNIFLWFGGGLIGWNFLFLDQLIWVYFTQPNNKISEEVRFLFTQKKWKQGIEVLKVKEYEMERLAFKSVLFQICWLVLVFFVLTSTSSLLGKGIIMGVGLHLLLKEWQDFKKWRRFDWLFWQIKREITLKEQKFYLYILTTFFILLSFIV